MSKRILLCAAVVGLVVSGCTSVTRDQPGATPGPTAGAGSCNRDPCHITVTVTNCSVTLSYDPLHVYAKNVNIHWSIDPESVEYSFTDDGIVIKQDDAEFDDPRRTGGGKKFIWHNKNNKFGQPPRPYKYVVNVMRGTMRCAPHDPQIVNH